MERPYFKLTDEAIDKIASDLYSGFQFNFTSADVSEEDIKALVKYATGSENGYQLAKELEENTCCDIDVLIVEELDSISLLIDEEKEKMLKSWVKRNNIKPLFKVGNNVKYNGQESFINGLYEDRALYKVGKSIGSQLNHIVPYEKIEKENNE